MKKIIFLISLIMALGVWQNSYSMELKACHSKVKKELGKGIGKSTGRVLLSIVSLGLFTPAAIYEIKETNNIRNFYSLTSSVVKNKAGSTVKSLAQNLNVSTNIVMAAVKKNIGKICDDFFGEHEKGLLSYYEMDRIYPFIRIESLNQKYSHLLGSIKPSDPSFDNPFKTYGQDNSWESRGNSYKECVNPVYYGHYIKTLKEDIKVSELMALELDPNCAPRILFNWSGGGMLRSLRSKYSSHSRSWKKNLKTSFEGYEPNALFTSYSPMATFGYGKHSLRIKIKKGVKFYVFSTSGAWDACNKMTPQQKNNTVVVRWGKVYATNLMLLEFLICNFNVVHSWSVGGKKNYDEIIKDYKWMKMKGEVAGEYALYMHKKSGIPLFNARYDGMNTTPEAFKSKMAFKISKILSGQSREIYFNPLIPKREKTEYQHYLSDKKMYWNAFSN